MLTRVNDGETEGDHGVHGPTERSPVCLTKSTPTDTDVADDGALVVTISEEQELGRGTIGGTLNQAAGEDLMSSVDLMIIPRNEDAFAENIISGVLVGGARRPRNDDVGEGDAGRDKWLRDVDTELLQNGVGAYFVAFEEVVAGSPETKNSHDHIFPDGHIF